AAGGPVDGWGAGSQPEGSPEARTRRNGTRPCDVSPCLILLFPDERLPGPRLRRGRKMLRRERPAGNDFPALCPANEADRGGFLLPGRRGGRVRRTRSSGRPVWRFRGLSSCSVRSAETKFRAIISPLAFMRRQ